MPKVKISIELMAHLCKLALERSRKRFYARCFYPRVDAGEDAARVAEECRELSRRVRTFHKSDFEVAARVYIAKTKSYGLRLSTLFRKLRTLANDPEHKWIEFYKGDYGRQRGIYKLKNVEEVGG